jgi:hypothetical protein
MNHLPAANDADDDLPVLTDIITEPESDIPLLTDLLVVDEPLFNAALIEAELTPSEPSFNQTEWLASIEQKIIAQLETTFAEKLIALQQQAITQAIAEFKVELPKLLQEAMNQQNPHQK